MSRGPPWVSIPRVDVTGWRGYSAAQTGHETVVSARDHGRGRSRGDGKGTGGGLRSLLTGRSGMAGVWVGWGLRTGTGDLTRSAVGGSQDGAWSPRSSGARHPMSASPRKQITRQKGTPTGRARRGPVAVASDSGELPHWVASPTLKIVVSMLGGSSAHPAGAGVASRAYHGPCRATRGPPPARRDTRRSRQRGPSRTGRPNRGR